MRRSESTTGGNGANERITAPVLGAHLQTPGVGFHPGACGLDRISYGMVIMILIALGIIFGVPIIILAFYYSQPKNND